MGDWADEPQWDEFGDFEEVVWTDENGNHYLMEEIVDGHLRNIVAFLERQADAADSCGFLSEYAQEAAEHAAFMMRARAEDFRAEMARRGMS